MMNQKTKVFLTGATGVMGMAGLKELVKHHDDYEITVLARNSKINHRKLTAFEKKGIKVIWGDLLDPNSLKEGISDADIVLHVGGMVSPAADKDPERTLKINIGSMKLISEIVKDIESSDSLRTIKVVYIGSVSQYGSHLPPDHWAKVGNKLSAAKFDAYALSKIEAERILVESGLKKWVSLRQTAILHPGLLMKANDPVMFHVPLKGVIEWVSVEDSGRLLERVCRKNVPENFWNNFYNVGGGKNYRLTNYEFERKLLKAMGCPPPERIFETKWFATDNFHGVWFEDSDILNNILNFRNGNTFDDNLKQMKKELPWFFKLAPIAPSFIIKGFMKKVACSPMLGTLTWIKTNDLERIKASWGSIENYKTIPTWDKFEKPLLQKENKDSDNILSSSEVPNILRYEKCERGHEFKTSELMKEKGGHECPICLKERTEVKV